MAEGLTAVVRQGREEALTAGDEGKVLPYCTNVKGQDSLCGVRTIRAAWQCDNRKHSALNEFSARQETRMTA